MEIDLAQEITLPAAALAQLRRSLRDESGPLAAIQALHAAGYAAGESFYPGFHAILEGADDRASAHTLWSALSHFFHEKGWGTMEHEAVHPAVGVLHAQEWAEAVPNSESQPSCAFTTGLLSSLLSRVAGGPVAVLEVSCVSRGDDRCSFAFGSEAVIHEVYNRLLEGSTLAEAVEGL